MTHTPLMSKFAFDNNLIYLPFAYFLPEELYFRFPTLRKLPRTLNELFSDEEMIDLINSDQFLDDVWDAIALLVFPHTGFRGKFFDYEEHSPVWMFCYSHQLWMQLLALETGWGIDLVLQIPSTTYIKFFDSDDIKETMKVLVNIGLQTENFAETLDIMREYPCDEDFRPALSNARIDFYRKWYHVRTKAGVMLSLDDNLFIDEDNPEYNGDYYSIVPADERVDFNNIIEEDYCTRFKKLLSDRDRQILEMRELGLTFEYIAEKLGYKTHSAVVKRMNAIKKVFLEFQDKNNR